MQQDPLIRTVDPASARRQLARRGPGQIAAHPLWQEAQSRLSDRLSYIRQPGGLVFDHGLAQFGLAVSPPAGEVGLVWSVGLLAYLSDPRTTLAFWAKTMKPEGLLMFATLGPDTFRPLALALRDPDHQRHVPGYPDMHDLGDALVGLGLANPVMDVERLTLTYQSPQAALRDLRALGGNPLLGRPKGLSGRAWQQAVLATLEGLRSDGVIPLPVELVFGHAWAPGPRPAEDGLKTVQWVGRQPKTKDSGL